MLGAIESVVLFVPDIEAAAHWYGALLGVAVQYENERYAYVQTGTVVIGFHPADAKCPGGVGGSTVYWQVSDLEAAIERLRSLGAQLHRGPGTTSFGAKVAMMVDPFGCTIGLNQAGGTHDPIGRDGLPTPTTAT